MMTDVRLVSRKARANTKDLAHLKRLIITKELLATKNIEIFNRDLFYQQMHLLLII